LVREVSDILGREIAIMQDLPGPKIRVGLLKGGVITLRKGGEVNLVDEEVGASDEGNIPVNYKGLSGFLKPGNTVFLSDGTIKLRVTEIGPDRVKCICEDGGQLLSGKGINLPELSGRFNSFTREDRHFLEFGLSAGIDSVAVSFVRSSKDVNDVRRFISAAKRPPLLIAKIERRDAVRNLEEIAVASDALMVARGDLGVESPLESVPMVQKHVISLAASLGKPVITATQILESMVTNPTPTRAEVTDIANAILDGTDALMLSEETAVGRFPVACAQVIHRVAVVTEKSLQMRGERAGRSFAESTVEDTLTSAAVSLAKGIHAKLLCCRSESISTASKLARHRGPFPIVSVVKNRAQARRLSLVWGVFPLHIGDGSSLADGPGPMKFLQKMWKLRTGDRVVIVGEGDFFGSRGQMLFAAEVKAGVSAAHRSRRR
jgi:pyruvate kinase